ncbi:MAG TPA: amidohydrolase family protein [Gemmatimonadales bacterium]|nr:amidohydrolase family protein [Gemmatimonadales bacterium]
MRPLRLRAEWALPVDAPPIQHAAVLIGADGRIAAVGPDAGVPVPADADLEDLGPAILIPGFVNTHTHLELTGFEEHAPGLLRPPGGLAMTAEPEQLPFREWILNIRAIKARRNPEEFLEAARRGVRDCWAAGITTIADTGDSGSVIQALAELGGSGICYQEVFGPDPAQRPESMAGLEAAVGRLAAFAGGRIRLGVSPHAPYTVSGPLYAAVAAWAGARGLPMAVHVAESREESEFVTHRRGPFAETWVKRGIPLLDHESHQSPTPNPQSPVEWLDAHGVLGPSTLCVHAIQLSPADIALLARRDVPVAHCPLSNARHRHGAAPVGALRAAGIRVGLGTDSVASVGRLDCFAEARAARELGGLSAEAAVALATLEGARALGLGQETGSLTPGKWGDVVAVAAGNREAAPDRSPADEVLQAGPEGVRLTVLGGRVVYRRETPA